MKILSVGAELFNADRQTNMTKLMFAFRSFANAPTNSSTAGHETPQTLSKSKVNLRVLIQIIPAHPLPSHSFKNHTVVTDKIMNLILFSWI
jgi:hypothetical protein